MSNFDVRFLEPAKEFLENLDAKTKRKVLFNIWKSREINDPRLFKKFTDNLWEFRTRFGNHQIRFIGFWDRKERGLSLVIIANGFIKKSKKIPQSEIRKAEDLRKRYFTIQ